MEGREELLRAQRHQQDVALALLRIVAGGGAD
jgi:hypothetical protein